MRVRCDEPVEELNNTELFLQPFSCNFHFLCTWQGLPYLLPMNYTLWWSLVLTNGVCQNVVLHNGWTLFILCRRMLFSCSWRIHTQRFESRESMWTLFCLFIYKIFYRTHESNEVYSFPFLLNNSAVLVIVRPKGLLILLFHYMQCSPTIPAQTLL